MPPNPAYGLGDYRPASGKLTFAPGESSKTFTVAILDDAKVETTEVFGLALVNPTGGVTRAP